MLLLQIPVLFLLLLYRKAMRFYVPFFLPPFFFHFSYYKSSLKIFPPNQPDIYSYSFLIIVHQFLITVYSLHNRYLSAIWTNFQDFTIITTVTINVCLTVKWLRGSALLPD